MVSKKRTRGSPRTSNRLQRKRGIPHSHIWGQVEDKPAVFPPDPALLTDYLNEAWPTGLFDGGELNIVGGTNVEIIAGAGVVIDSYTDPLAIPFKQTLSWDTQDEAITAAPAVAGSFVFILMADGAVPGPVAGTNLGVLTQIATQPTAAQVRDNIFIGFVIHNGDEWGEVSSPNVANNAAHMLSEWINQIAGPTFIKSGGAITEAASFTLDRAAGAVWERNRNWHVDRKNPHVENFLAQPGFQWRYVNRDFTDVSALTNTVDPTQYDDGGTVSPMPLPANAASVQRLYVDPRDNYWVLWGQYTYDNYLDASSSIGADSAGTVLPFVLDAGSLLLGYIVSERGKTDWDADEARFVSAAAGGTGGAGASVTAWLGLTDTPVDYVGQARKSTQVNAAESALEFVTPMRWRNLWAQQQYYAGDVVRDGNWLMIANKDTEERAGPQPTGSAFFVYDGTISTTPVSAKQIIFGTRYTITVGGYVTGYRIYTITGNQYYAYSVLDPLGSPIFEQLAAFTADQTGWTEFALPSSLIPVGLEIDLVVGVTEPDPTPTVFFGNWDYLTPQNITVPVAGEITHARGQPDRIDVNKTDDDAGDRSAELEALTVGDIINGAGVRWTIQSSTDNVTYMTYVVAPAAAGSPTGVQNFNFETVTATPITYAVDVDYNLGNANVSGLLGVDTAYDSIVPDNNQYGADLKVQAADISADWDAMSAA